MSAHEIRSTRSARIARNKANRGSDCAKSLKVWRDHHRRKPDVVDMDFSESMKAARKFVMTEFACQIAHIGTLTRSGGFVMN